MAGKVWSSSRDSEHMMYWILFYMDFWSVHLKESFTQLGDDVNSISTNTLKTFPSSKGLSTRKQKELECSWGGRRTSQPKVPCQTHVCHQLGTHVKQPMSLRQENVRVWTSFPGTSHHRGLSGCHNTHANPAESNFCLPWLPGYRNPTWWHSIGLPPPKKLDVQNL